jgi:hypothetical protein
MGSGGMIVMSDKDCMVNIAKFYLEFTVDESCGRCLPCRMGTKRLHEILVNITEGKGTPADLRELQGAVHVIIDSALCGLGQTAPNPVLSTMKYFWMSTRRTCWRSAARRACARSCSATRSSRRNASAAPPAPASARSTASQGSVKQLHFIDQARCIKCGACMTKCKFKAISRN